MFRSSISILLVIVALANSALLPDYFERCSLSEPNVNKCITDNAIKAWPKLIQGDKNVHLQSLDPLYVSHIHGSINDKLVSNISNAIISGLADIKIDEIKLDKDKKKFDLYFLIPHFNIIGEYSINGKLINLQLDGEGHVNNTFENFKCHLTMDYELIEKRNKHYIEVTKNFMVYNTTLIHIDLDNLGDRVNQLLNENWEAANKEFSESAGIIFGEVFTSVLGHFFKKVSFEELFSK